MTPPEPIAVYLDHKLAAQLARSASEAASGGNSKWLLEDVVYLFTDAQQSEIAGRTGRSPTPEQFFERVCDFTNRFERHSQKELANVFDELSAFFASAAVTFSYEGGAPPAIVPKGHRVGGK